MDVRFFGYETPDDSADGQLVRVVMRELHLDMWPVWLFVRVGCPALLTGDQACAIVRLLIDYKTRVHRPARGLSLGGDEPN